MWWLRLKLVFSIRKCHNFNRSVFAKTKFIFQIKGEKVFDYVITFIVTVFFFKGGNLGRLDDAKQRKRGMALLFDNHIESSIDLIHLFFKFTLQQFQGTFNQLIYFSFIAMKVSSVTAELVSCSVTSMDFFDRLQEQGLTAAILIL